MDLSFGGAMFVVLMVFGVALVLIGKEARGKKKPATQTNDRRLAALAKVAMVVEETLLTPAERSFYGVLESAIPEGYRLFSKVRVVDVMQPRGENSPYNSVLNSIKQKHFDFVLVDQATTRPVMAIELNDKSHGRKDRRDRDEYLSAVCERAGFPLLHVKARRSYNPSEIRNLILEHLGGEPLLAEQTA